MTRILWDDKKTLMCVTTSGFYLSLVGDFKRFNWLRCLVYD